ncbi:helicase-related protein [Arthrobacter sp.]|uniref:helicase-related protein n=1 Tax=Arthrobacter sp. TaxID=1667 RepID=UPI0026DFFC6C|nr:helicase-related protein [Arthrobacter sp.]MDO5752462.1 helicase [Arthrobacter sp.]
MPQLFDKADWATERAKLQEVLTEKEYNAASRTTINAHYTDAAIVQQMWRAIEDLGFTSGDVLEPGSGSGTFIGMAPAGASMTGVELDPLTASISQALYPHATIRNESFADTPIQRNSFDLAVGNVPFGTTSLHDPSFNAGKHSMHNHFIIKSLEAVKPGGYVAVLSSSFTLDAANPSARREMSALADLVGAVRLPTAAHRRAAGTDALTDVLLFRKRESGREPANTEWETVGPKIVDGTNIKINNYYDTHPQNVLGTITVGTGMYGPGTVTVKAEGELSEVPTLLGTRLQNITQDALEQDRAFEPIQQALAVQPAALLSTGNAVWDGTIRAERDGTFTIAENNSYVPFDFPKKHAPELRQLLGLRDGARALIEMEAADQEDTPALAEKRKALGKAYAVYVDKYGPVNRYTLRERSNKDTGEPTFSRSTPTAVQKLQANDPFGGLPAALERFQDETQQASPGGLLQERQVLVRKPVRGAETIDEALAICLDTYGAPDLDTIADLVGSTPEEARTQLGTLVFDDPSSNTLLTAPEYLSGNVRIKLEEAREAASKDPRWNTNVESLERVQPTPVGMDDVEARLGAVWVSPDHHQAFVREILNDPSATVTGVGSGIWRVKANRGTLKATSEWGTSRRPAPDLLQAILEQKTIQVEDKDDDGKLVANMEETEAAVEAASQLQERFAEWVWEDPARANELIAEYNKRFNSIALRDYTNEGQRLTLPGLAVSFEPHQHQRTAVARIISEPAVGLFHEVGAGKTAEMVMGATELKRLGMVNKPLIVVPGHMLEQFTREWLELYPQAVLLSAATDDLSTKANNVNRRQQFVARAAMNDWDGIIMTQTAFQSIGVRPETIEAYQDTLISDVRQTITNALEAGEDRTTVKKLETKLQAEEERMKKLMGAAPDPGLCFEDMGVDYLFVDEAHDFKNLRTVTNIKGAAIDGSERATDMHLKLEYLRSTHGERVGTMATGTPIANSLTEAHVVQRFLRPDLLQAAGVENFDVWGATFGETVTAIEMDAGGRLKNKARFAKFKNVPEMLRTFHVFADVKLAEDLDLDTPALAPREGDGARQPELVLLPRPAELGKYMEVLGERLDSLSGWSQKGEDNALTIYGDGRKAALDMRMVGIEPTSTTKLDLVTDKILKVWEANRENQYTINDKSEVISERRGALQLVFCDEGTPSDKKGPDGKPVWTPYQQIKDQLVTGGIQPEQVQFVHDYPNAAQKAALFEKCRNGEVAVVLGSTKKMGTGTNIQLRAKALHHVTCPWRPADLTQRDGRIIRQGNGNAEINIYQYATVGSQDSAAWDGIQRKATMINQVLRGSLDVREIEDVGDQALNAAQIKALTSGNPLLIEKIEADAARTRFERLKRSHERTHTNVRWAKSNALTSIETAQRKLPAVMAAIPAVTPTSGDAFTMRFDSGAMDKRTEALAAIVQWTKEHTPDYGNYGFTPKDYGTMATLGGHELLVSNAYHQSRLGQYQDLLIEVKGVPDTGLVLARREIMEGGAGIITRLENRVASIPDIAQKLQATIANQQLALIEAEEQLTRPFKYENELAQARETSKDLDAKLKASLEPKKEPKEAPEAGPQQPPTDEERMLAKAMEAKAFAQSQYGSPRPQPATAGQRDRTPPSTTKTNGPTKAPQRPAPERGTW